MGCYLKEEEEGENEEGKPETGEEEGEDSFSVAEAGGRCAERLHKPVLMTHPAHLL